MAKAAKTKKTASADKAAAGNPDKPVAGKPAATASKGKAASSEPLEPAGTIFVGMSVQAGTAHAWHLANRHGLATGATGTGKTVTLQVLAEGFSRNGVPVFAADIKGDLSGISQMGEAKPASGRARAEHGTGIPARSVSRRCSGTCSANRAHPIRATVTEMGPLLLARLLDLNDVQEGVLNVAFKIADDGRAAAARLQGSARRSSMPSRRSAARRRPMRAPAIRSSTRSSARSQATATSPSRPSAPSSARCWCSRTRAARNSSASLRST